LRLPTKTGTDGQQRGFVGRAGVETLARDENDEMTGRLTRRAGGKVGDNFVCFIRSD